MRFRVIKISLALAAVLVPVAGAMFYRVQERAMERQVAEALEAVARLKAEQIRAWRNDQLVDAQFLLSPLTQHHSGVAFWTDPAATVDLELRQMLVSVALQHDYSNILLTDPEGRVRHSLSGSVEHRLEQSQAFQEALRECRPVFQDLHVCGENPLPHSAVIAPVCDTSFSEPRPLGAVIFITDASQFLYPLLQSWPTPSATAETLLVRRDGDEVLFLNDLRHRPAAALSLRIPVGRGEVPAAMAVLGRKGFVRGQDYRGVEVAAVILPVPDSAWFMVAKVDEREAFADWRFRSALLAALSIGLSGFLAALLLVLRQQEKRRHYQALYRAETALREEAERQAVTLRAIGDAVIATDAEGRVQILNPVAEALIGWSEAEARGRPLAEVFRIVNEDTLEPCADPVARVLQDGVVVGLANHTLLIDRNGTSRPIADSGAPIRNAQGAIVGVVLVFRDQSKDRRQAKLTAARLALIDAAAEYSADALLQQALDTIGRLTASPIGFCHFVGADGMRLELQQWSSQTLESFCRVEAEKGHRALDRAGVWADCVRQGRAVIHNDYLALPDRKGMPEGHPHLFRSLMVPIRRGERTVAIVGVGNKAQDYTEDDLETVTFLADVAWEVVHRRRDQEARRDSEKRYRRLFESAGDGVLIVDAAAGRVLDANPALLRLVGCEPPALLHRPLWEIPSFSAVASSPEAFATLARQSVIPPRELTLTSAGGEAIAVELAGTVYAVDHAPVLQLHLRDISARRRARQERERLLAALEQAGEMVVITDPEGCIEYVNPAFERVTGYPAAEALGRNPRFLQSGSQDAEFYRQMWQTIESGRTWTGRMVKRRKDGSLFTEEATISPVFDGSGGIVNYVAVKRDVSEQLQLEAQLRQAQKLESVGRLAGGGGS